MALRAKCLCWCARPAFGFQSLEFCFISMAFWPGNVQLVYAMWPSGLVTGGHLERFPTTHGLSFILLFLLALPGPKKNAEVLPRSLILLSCRASERGSLQALRLALHCHGDHVCVGGMCIFLPWSSWQGTRQCDSGHPTVEEEASQGC